MAKLLVLVAPLLRFVHLVHTESLKEEYACLKAETINSSQHFCMRYYPAFRKLPISSSLAVPINLVNATKYDGCSELDVTYNQEAAFTIATNACAIEETIVNFNKANVTALIMLSSEPYFDKFNVNETSDLDMIVGFVSNETTNALLNLFATGADIKVSMYSIHKPHLHLSLIVIGVIWTIAVFTVALGSFWSGELRVEQHRKGLTYLFMTGGNGFQRKEIPRSESPPTDSDAVRQPARPMSALNVLSLVVPVYVFFTGAMLIIFYSFPLFAIYYINGCFVLSSFVSLIGFLGPVVDEIPIGTTKIPQKLQPSFLGSLQIRHLFLILFSIGINTAWLVFRLEPWSWVLQDLLGIVTLLFMLANIRLPNLRICSVLLIFMFFYDILFVLVTPFLTMDGESIMFSVINTQEHLPMALRVPHLGSGPITICLSSYSLLGFGDMLIPGFLVSYCHAFDRLHRPKPDPLYYAVSALSYQLSLAVAGAALFFMRTPQPALLYVVPGTLIPVVLIAACRGELRAMWEGNFREPPRPRTSRPLPLPNNSVSLPHGAA